MIKIRSYDDADRSALVELLIECQRHFHMPLPSGIDVESDLVKLPAGVEILIAEKDGKIAGFAAFSALYPGPVTRPQLYLKEIFVSEPHRSQGVGRKLMSELIQIAVKRGYTRIDWITDENNAAARTFYEQQIGAKLMTKTVGYRLADGALLAAAEKLASS